MNRVVLMGRLVRDPEVKYSKNANALAIARYTLAVNRRRGRSEQGEQQQQTDFINLVAWRQTADFISKYFRKGSALCVTGSIQTRSWTDGQGQKRYATEVVVDEAMFVDSRGEGGDVGASYTTDAYGAAPSYSSNAGTAPNFEDHNTDDDLPF